MQIILDAEEGWSIMSLVVSQVLDQAELSDEAKATLRRWRTEHNVNTTEMADLTVGMNESIGTVLDEQTTKLVRRQGWYVSTRKS